MGERGVGQGDEGSHRPDPRTPPPIPRDRRRGGRAPRRGSGRLRDPADIGRRRRKRRARVPRQDGGGAETTARSAAVLRREGRPAIRPDRLRAVDHEHHRRGHPSGRARGRARARRRAPVRGAATARRPPAGRAGAGGDPGASDRGPGRDRAGGAEHGHAADREDRGRGYRAGIRTRSPRRWRTNSGTSCAAPPRTRTPSGSSSSGLSSSRRKTWPDARTSPDRPEA